MAVGILGVGKALPERIVTNHELASELDTSDAWIVERLGVRERRVADADVATSDLAVAAAWQAMREAGAQPGDIDLIVVATATPDYPQPATACIVQRKLRAPKAVAFDIAAVCCGFIYALHVAESLVRASGYRRALVIGADCFSKIIDPKDRTARAIFGDGAGAVLLGPVRSGVGIQAAQLRTFGDLFETVMCPAGGSRTPASPAAISDGKHWFAMDGRGVYDFAVRELPRVVRAVLDRVGKSPADVDLFIPHQANRNIIRATAELLDVPQERFFTNLEYYGNTAAASVPIALADAYYAGRVRDGDNLVLAAVGGGMTAGALQLFWGAE
jgi:3-oxoacyl-[acyl-carrier-protein] synthase-3